MRKVKPKYIFYFSLFIIPFILGFIYSNNPSIISDDHLNSKVISGSITPIISLDYIIITETPIPTKIPTPTYTPAPTKIFISSTQFDEWFDKAARKESVNKELLKKIAVCESRLNPVANNGPYGGLYQFSEATWISTRKLMNENSNPNLRFDPQEAIKTAAFRLATYGSAAWPNCIKD